MKFTENAIDEKFLGAKGDEGTQNVEASLVAEYLLDKNTVYDMEQMFGFKNVLLIEEIPDIFMQEVYESGFSISTLKDFLNKTKKQVNLMLATEMIKENQVDSNVDSLEKQ